MERYESDVEEGDEEGDQILLTLSERFLEEKDTNGVVGGTHVHVHCIYMYVHVSAINFCGIHYAGTSLQTVDRLDLGCLMTAKVEQKAWKSAQQ